MKKLFTLLFLAIIAFTITGCGKEEPVNNENNKQEEKQEEKKQEESNYSYVDDEVIEFDDEDNAPPKSKTVPSTLINCENCVFTFFKDKKTFGSKVSNYVKDYSTLKDNQGYQRRRFLGLILDSNGSIQRAYACGIQSGKAYCLEGTSDGSQFEYNVGILNQVFEPSECEYNSNGTRYTCTRVDETNGDTRRDGYVSVHYEENCHVFGKTIDHDVEIYCY